jgi:acyl-CoA reductase-like NAD-dependent aldehyde dehydrogenase
VDVASAAFLAWKLLNPTKKRDILLKACDIMAARTEEFAGYFQAEVGADPQFAVGSIHGSIATMKDMAGRLSSIQAQAPTCADDSQSAIVFKEPYGVVLAILPW